MASPLRRSKRGQPLVVDVSSEHDKRYGDYFSSVLLTRPAKAEDLTQEDEDLLDEDEANAIFYREFRRPKLNSTKFKAKDKGTTDGSKKEVFELGDTVLVRSNARLPSIGVITSMWNVSRQDPFDCKLDNSEKVRIHWFLRPAELPRIRAHRDHFHNEIYFSLSNSAVISPASIIGSCSVSSKQPKGSKLKSSLAWAVTPANEKAQKSNEFFCNFAIDDMRGLYYEFDWEKHRVEALSESNEKEVDGAQWKVFVEESDNERTRKSSKRLKRKVREDSEQDDNDSDYSSEDVENDYAQQSDDDNKSTSGDPSEESEDELAMPRTPSKRSPTKRKAASNSFSTPRRAKRPRITAMPTPHTKAAIKSRRARKVKPTNLISQFRETAFASDHRYLEDLPEDPWLRAMQVLHVAARPDALPCREDEFVKILKAVESLLEEGSGGCIYISGVPGTGKTATVHTVVRELKRMAERNEVNPFSYVEINGLKIPEPTAAYPLLWEAVSCHDVANDGSLKVSSKEALKQLARHFGRGVRSGPAGHACVVLMDELDQLMTTKQDVVYNFFNWPTMVNSKLVVIAVANTMDLPERVMNGRVRSRLGMVRINFQPYTTPQLVKIVHARLEGAKKVLTGKVADVITPDGIKFASMKVSSISGDARRVLDICRRVVETVQSEQRTAKTEDVRDVIKMMQSSPTAAFLKDCSLHERIMLAALLKCARRNGIEEVKWSDVQNQHLNYTNVLTGDEDSMRKPTLTELSFVLDSLVGSRAMLIEEGAVATKKADGDRRVLLNIEQSEVERVLAEIGGQRWKNALGT